VGIRCSLQAANWRGLVLSICELSIVLNFKHELHCKA
jgi:hypothetical protein